MIMEFYLSNNDEKFYINFKLDKSYKSFVIRCNGLVMLTSDSMKLAQDIAYTDKSLKYNIRNVAANNTYTINVSYEDSPSESRTITINSLFDSKEFNDSFAYDDELGAIYSKDKTIFRVWSPISDKITLLLDGNKYEMTKIKGIFEVSVNGDQNGKYYTYLVDNYKYKDQEVVDPYAKAVAEDGRYGVVVDMEATNPLGWADLEINEIDFNNLVIYESHVADLTASDTWNGKNPKTFKGFFEEGTTYEDIPTGFDHIKSLGINAVQLQPINDAYNFYENGKLKYNWNYNPRNYNALNNIFSTSPIDAIKDFKSLVLAYTKKGINIIMDVVYNHVYKAEISAFEILMPGYYYRYYGMELSNGSGCGCELASERYMVRKFIIDSVLYYAKEYKIAGFRFDLMGLIDIDTMNLLREELNKINPFIALYGEPWMGGGSVLDSRISSTKNNLANINAGYFNDDIRDALIKGGFSNNSYCGYANSINASDHDIYNLTRGIKGSPNAINYASCHDNYTLYDRIVASGAEGNILEMALLANSIILTSKGSAFIYSGEEFLRSKNGNNNSYNAPYELNALDYSLLKKNYSMVEKYRKLIYMHHEGMFNDIGFVYVSDNHSLISYESGKYKVIHNSYNPEYFDMSGYDIYYDSKDTYPVDNIIRPYETLVLIKKEDEKKSIRQSGILAHITTLNGKHGIGTLGKESYDFVDFLSEAGVRIWQILPLVPTNYGDSPYQSVSSTALNYYMINFDILESKGLLKREEYENVFDNTRINYERMFYEKTRILKKAYERFEKNDDFVSFERCGKYEDFAVFMAIKENHGYVEWEKWNEPYKTYSKEVYSLAKKSFNDSYMFWVWTQYEFILEWNDLHKYAIEHNVRIMGDMPYYVAYDSVEVWKNPEMFDLRNVGGCPPDIFSSDGQLWGNPCYDWDYMRRTNFKWYSDRINSAFDFIDILRIDHFRGFDRYYAIPKGMKDAKIGKWLDGPKRDLFLDKMNLDIVAEDLGIIDDGVIDLMNATKYPGMRVFQFGLDGNLSGNNVPRNYPMNSIAYTGTHDNMPMMEYLESLDDEQLKIAYDTIEAECENMNIECVIKDNKDAVKYMVRLIFESKSNTAIVPIQDVILSGKGSRINKPSTISTDNWSFMIKDKDLDDKLKNYLKDLIKLSGR